MIYSTVAVVIASYKRPIELEKCLLGLSNQVRAPNEIVVVVRENDENTISVVEKYGVKHVIVQSPGVAAAWQLGYLNVTSEIVAFIDDDAVPHMEWTYKISRHFSNSENLGMLCGRDIIPHQKHINSSKLKVGTITSTGRVLGNHHLGSGEKRPAIIAKGVNMAYRTKVLRQLDLASAVSGRGAQFGTEMFMSLFVISQGFDGLYDPNLTVDHYPADRPLGDSRGAMNFERITQDVVNETAAIQAFASKIQKTTTFARAVLIGTRKHPGFTIFIYLVVTGSNHNAWTLYKTVQKALILGKIKGKLLENKYIRNRFVVMS